MNYILKITDTLVDDSPGEMHVILERCTVHDFSSRPANQIEPSCAYNTFQLRKSLQCYFLGEYTVYVDKSGSVDY